jgi:hypothetical protein
MYCKFMDDTTKVRCSVQKSLAGEGGFQAVLAGFSFWGELPQEQNFGLTCTAPETLWYSIDVYEDGEYITSDAIPAWIWDLLESYGLFDELEAEGITLKITGEFCDLDIDI